MTNTRQFGSAVFSRHARSQMRRRGVTEAEVRAVLASPEQVLAVRDGRVVAQAISGQGSLLRVFVAVEADPPVIVTVYRTSKVAKYRSG